jgi:tetratricopeptide (TPR) repeat protein
LYQQSGTTPDRKVQGTHGGEKPVGCRPHFLIFLLRGVERFRYKRRGECERAVADFNRAIALHPAVSGLYLQRGHAYRTAGQYDRARADFQQALRLAERTNDLSAKLGAELGLKKLDR